MEEQHWEPPEHERVYYRHTQTGDLGYACQHDGKDCIRYDRPNQMHVVPHIEGKWDLEEQHTVIPDISLVKIAFEADKQLCLLMGHHDLAKREWISLSDEQRNKWRQVGPTRPTVRRRLYRVIMDVLRTEND